MLFMLAISSINVVAVHDADAAAGPEPASLMYPITDGAVEELRRSGAPVRCFLIVLPMRDCPEFIIHAEYGKFLLGILNPSSCIIDYEDRKMHTSRLMGAESVSYQSTLLLIWLNSSGEYCYQAYKASKDYGTSLHLEPYQSQARL